MRYSGLGRTVTWVGFGLSGLAVLSDRVEAQDPDSVVAAPTRPVRGSWIQDRRTIPVGAIVTVVVDERMTARERTSRIATASRRSSMAASAGSADFTLPFTSGSLSSDRNNEDRKTGEANRRGDLSSVFTVTVVGIEPSGMLRIGGTRMIEIDGRKQEWELAGLIRPEDVDADNLIPSNRIANASIYYKGKNIGPGQSLVARILGIFWP